MKLKNIKEDGFTIIEVLIVLAIAGLIMLVVFLAVPALQRNSRNTQRANDAARVAGAISECTVNNNGDTTDCSSTAQLANYIDVAQNQQLFTLTPGANGTLEVLGLRTGFQCDTDGKLPQPGGGARAVALHYQVETSGTPEDRCIGV